MKLNATIAIRFALILLLVLALALISRRLQADTGTCNGVSVTIPFTDVAGNPFFCAIAEAYFSGLTNGTSATTYSPSDPVPREQMAAFITRTLDQSLRRGNQRAALNQWWTLQIIDLEMFTPLSGSVVNDVVCDGVDLWSIGSEVNRVRDGAVIANFPGPTGTTGVIAGGRVYVAGGRSLWWIGIGNQHVSTVSSNFTPNLTCITFDGEYIWTGSDAGVLGKTSVLASTVTTVSTTFFSLQGMLYDGANVWVTESGSTILGHLYRLDSNGVITLSVTTGIDPRRPIFDGLNIWVPNHTSNTVTVYRASTGTLLATLSGNGLNGPTAAAFDGQRIMVINQNDRVSLWKAADLSPLGSTSLSLFGGDGSLHGLCSDGVSFWVATNRELSILLTRF